MSIFQSKVTDIQKENSNYYRSSGFGQVVPTASVKQTELKENPWFLSISNASESDIKDSLSLDNSMFGYSVIVADYGSSRQTRTIVNPKGVNSYAGTSTGKDQAVVPGQDTFFELNYNNHISPSVLGMYSLEQGNTPQNPNTEPSTQPGDPNTPLTGTLQGEIGGDTSGELAPFNPGVPSSGIGYGPGQYNPNQGSLGANQPAMSPAGISKTDIDVKGNKTPTKDNGLGPQQNPIRTGIDIIMPAGLKDIFNFDFLGI
jgi:hypothetical protein